MGCIGELTGLAGEEKSAHTEGAEVTRRPQGSLRPLRDLGALCVSVSRCLPRRPYFNPLVDLLPADVELGGVTGGVFEGNAHGFLGGGEGFGLHGGAAEVLRFVVDGAPLACFFAEDELPGCAGGGGQGV
jgi:hypothetical protein